MKTLNDIKRRGGSARAIRLIVLGGLGMLGAGALATAVWAMTVQPVVIDLAASGRGASSVLTVENTFATPLPTEIRVEDLTLNEQGVVGTGADSGDLVVFPPQALIQPGQTQTFRVQYVGDPELQRSKHYYITVAQLPVQLPEGESAIQILYNFQVLVSVAPTGVQPAISVTSAEIGTTEDGKRQALLTVSNPSRAHGYLAKGRLRLIVRDAQGGEVLRRTLSGPEMQQTVGFGLVGAEQSRSLFIPIDLPAQGASVEARYTPENGR